MLKNRFCEIPFTSFRVSTTGDVSICSPDRMKIPVVGNLLTTSASDVWNSDKAQAIRASILDGSYKYCIDTYCPALQKNSLPSKVGISDPEMRDIIDNNIVNLDKSPRIINMHIDKTCNLKCPSCRTDIIGIKGRDLQRAESVRDNIIDSNLLSDARNMILCGYGEVFASSIYLGFLRKLAPDKYPNLRIKILTNGLLLNERMWQSFSNAHSLIDEVSVSIDAATSETYRLNRGGDFDRLLKNLDFVSHLRMSGVVKRYTLNFCVQNNNFREIPAFIELGKKLSVDRVYFQKIANAGGAGMDDYTERAVHLIDHQNYVEFSKILHSPMANDRIVDLYSLGGVEKPKSSLRDKHGASRLIDARQSLLDPIKTEIKSLISPNTRSDSQRDILKTQDRSVQSVPRGADASAAVALFEAALPDWTSWLIRSHHGKNPFAAEVSRSIDETNNRNSFIGHGSTPLAAMIDAIAKANNTDVV